MGKTNRFHGTIGHVDVPFVVSDTEKDPSPYAGMPAGIELLSEWHVKRYNMADPLDQERLVDNPAAPSGNGGDGTEWEIDEYGVAGGGSLSFTVNSFPPYLRLTTHSDENDGWQLQGSGVLGAPSELFDLTVAEAIYMDLICRFTDANNDDDAVDEMEFFFGFAPQDTDLLDGTTPDYVGLFKPDGSGTVSLVADRAATAMGSAGASTSLVDLSTADVAAATAGTNIANTWVRMAIMAVMDQTNSVGSMYAWFWANYGGRNNPHRWVQYAQSVMQDASGNAEHPNQAMAPSIAFDTGEGLAKNLDIANLVVASKFVLG